jgi:predicted AlkP superfamily pyrophosphatase or phosphodiesterase
MSPGSRLAAFIGFLAVLQVLGIWFFTRGFFVHKAVLPGHTIQSATEDGAFDRLVFMVVDALRRSVSRNAIFTDYFTNLMLRICFR